jgi:hypothetical protein
MPVPAALLSPAPAPPQISRKCGHCEEEEAKLHAKPDGGQPLAGDAPPIVQQVLQTPGQQLDAGARAFMEPRFGRTLGQVRVHRDSDAAESAGSIGALAYASGNHVVFGAGQYTPASSAGQRLLAHELAHVLQQQGAPAIRRACGPEGIGTPAGCETGDPVFTPGPTFHFVVNCDDWVTGDDKGLLGAAQAIPAASSIQIDAYASSEGPEAFNASLSCARALKAKSVLVDGKIPESRITRIVAHGATAGKVEDRRSVVIRAADAAPAPQPAAPPAGGQTPAVPDAQQQPLPGPRVDGGYPAAAPANPVTRDAATKALTDYLNRAQTAQGGQSVRVTPPVDLAIRKMFPVGDINSGMRLDGLLGTPNMIPGKPAELAAAVTKLLPDTIPGARIAHLPTAAVTETPDNSPKSLGDAVGKLLVDSTLAPLMKKLNVPADVQKTITDGLRDATSDMLVAVADAAMSNAPIDAQTKAAIHGAIENFIKYPVKPTPDKRKDPAGDPNNPPQGPPAQDVSVPEANRHDIKSPPIPAGIPQAPDAPKPDVPKPATPAEATSVDQIIQGLDDGYLLPASAKAADIDTYGNAKEIARTIANQMGATDKQKSPTTVTITLSASYRKAEGLADVFDKVADLVNKIAKVMPGGAAKVADVIITPASAANDQTLPMRRVIHLH